MSGSDHIATRRRLSPATAAGILPHHRDAIATCRSRTSTIAMLLAIALGVGSTGCTQLKLPSARGLDLMSPSSVMQFAGSGGKKDPIYSMPDGSVPAESFSPSGALTEEAYQKIREAKAQNAIVLQVAGDPEPARVLPLPEGNRSVFVSELLTQTGVTRKFGSIQAALYRPSPESITGVKMDIRFTEDGNIDPATDYGLRPGDRVQVSRKSTTTWESVVNLVLRR